MFETDGFWIISNHTEEHDHQVLFMQLHILTFSHVTKERFCTQIVVQKISFVMKNVSATNASMFTSALSMLSREKERLESISSLFHLIRSVMQNQTDSRFTDEIQPQRVSNQHTDHLQNYKPTERKRERCRKFCWFYFLTADTFSCIYFPLPFSTIDPIFRIKYTCRKKKKGWVGFYIEHIGFLTQF